MWNLPGPGIEPTSPELAGRFLTTVPPEKSLAQIFVAENIVLLRVEDFALDWDFPRNKLLYLWISMRGYDGRNRGITTHN